MSDKQAVDVFTDDDGHLALPVEPFRRIFRPTGCRLDPIEGFPVVWQFTEGKGGRSGVVLNVLGFLNGGAMSISSRGWLYETERDGRQVALFLPGSPKRMRLSETRYKVLAPEPAGAPLFPAAWPKEAVLRVIRARFRTIVVLNAEFLLAQVPRLTASAVTPAPAPLADPPPHPAPLVQP
jgi:hypothetical protein